MTGNHLKNLILSEGYSINRMAELIGIAQPNLLALLKHEDVRTGLVEKVAEAMGKPLAFFYGETYGNVSQNSGHNSATAINNSTATATSNDERILTLLLNKDEQLTLSMKQTIIAQEQTSKAQSQMDRILDQYCNK